MKRTLVIPLLLLSACSPKPCEQWKGWDFPRLKKISSCAEGRISLELDGEPESLWAMFEQRGYERGSSEAKLTRKDDAVIFAKKGDPLAYQVVNEGGALTISSRPAEDVAFLSAAELARVDAYPQALAKWHASLKELPAVFDASKGAECDRALLSEAIKPLTPEGLVPFLLNVDQLASGTETRVGVPRLLEAYERTAPKQLRTAAARFSSLEKRKALIAFRVTEHVAPRFVDGHREGMPDGGMYEPYEPGTVSMDLALVEFAPLRVVCRAPLTVRSSPALNADANFDLDLQMNVGLASQAAFSFR